MIETDFTRLVGCTVPIQLAGMGPIISPELAAAASEAGALGQITFVQTDPAVASGWIGSSNSRRNPTEST